MTATYTRPAEAARAIRAAVKTATADGTLTLPEGAKVSVRTSTASAMAAVDITVTGASDGWARTGSSWATRTPAAKAAADVLCAIRDAHWHTDGRHTFGDIDVATAAYGKVSL